MKIHGGRPPESQDAYLRAQKTTGKEAVEGKGAVEKRKVGDRVDLTGAGRVEELKAEIQRLPEVRTDRIEAVKKAIEAGTYRIDAEKILSRMIDEL